MALPGTNQEIKKKYFRKFLQFGMHCNVAASSIATFRPPHLANLFTVKLFDSSTTRCNPRKPIALTVQYSWRAYCEGSVSMLI